MHRTAITGSSGFLGTHLIKQLTERGDEVIRIPRELLYKEGLKEFLQESKPDYIYHLASYGNMAHQKEEAKIFDANVIGTWNLLQASKHIPYMAFINVSTSSVLLDHETFYSATKAGAERLCKAFIDEFNKPIISFRPYSVYGPEEASYRLIPTIFRSCLEGEPMKLSPNAVHDWVYVDDCVSSLIGVAESVEMSELFYTYNCGTGIGTTNQRIVNLIEDITGKKANITEIKDLRKFDNKEWVHEDVEVDKIKLREGLQLIYEDYKINGEKGVR